MRGGRKGERERADVYVYRVKSEKEVYRAKTLC